MEQLRLLRQEAHARFLAQKDTDAPGSAPPAQAAAPPPPAAKPSGGGGASFLAGLPSDMLNAPISSLLADAPPAEPPAKKPRVEEHSMRVPPDRTAEIRSLLQQPPPLEPRILAWNIDGLDEVGDERDRMLRTLAVAKEVAFHRPVAVLLQEVVPPALELLSAPQVLGGHYDVVVPDDPPLPYYVAILLDRRRTKRVGKVATENFPGSKMGRQLLTVAVEIAGSGGPPVLLATAHLESTKDMGDERRRQLTTSLRRLREAVGKPAAGGGSGSSAVVGMALLAGDLNLRDNEVKDVSRTLGPGAPGIADAWIFCGSPSNHKWTWDTAENNNLGVTYTCRTRFDRVFFAAPGVTDSCSICGPPQGAKGKAAKAAGTVTTGSAGWRPTGIALLGKERVPGLGRFPSDHWGVLTSWTAGTASDVALASAAAPPPASTSAKFATSPASCAGQAGGQEMPGLLPNVVAGKVFINLND